MAMFSPSPRRSLAVAIALFAAGAAVEAKSANQQDYAACPVRHTPEYFCCAYSDSTMEVYTKYNRPSGGAFESYYTDGWNLQRQVNYPYHKFTPDTPKFRYDEPESVCRVQSVVTDAATGALTQTLQCGGQNASLAEDSQDATVFWTFGSNVRNNNASFPIGATCTSLMNEDGSLDTVAKAACASTSTAATPRFTTFVEAPLLVIYFLYLACLVLVALWAGFKKMAQSNTRGLGSTDDKTQKLIATPETPSKSVAGHPDGRRLTVRASDTNIQLAASDQIMQSGYVRSIPGMLVFACVVLATLGLNVVLMVVIADYYGCFEPVLFDASENNSRVFFVVWIISSVWFVVIVQTQEALFNFFRLRAPLKSCDYVYMIKRDDTEVLLADRSGISDLVAKFEGFFSPKGKVSGFKKTVPVQVIDDLRVVEFQHLRYIYDEGAQRFVPGAVALGRTYDDILRDASGLSSREATTRLNTVGTNAVEVEMPSLAVSMAHEFFTLFYIYQIMCYYVWYYFTYYNLGIVMTVVIIGSAVVNIYTNRQMQASIVQMTRYRTDVTVFRDGEWKTLDSPDVVPGDLVRVAENWVLPCDLAIVKGSTVCDESMLTGESMPVQKFPVPERSRDVYDAEGRSKKHTLFSGTRVLSSGRNEEILAVVQTTGAHTTKGQLIQSILFPIPMRFKYNEHLKVLISVLLIYGVIACYCIIVFLTGNGNLTNKMAAFCYSIFMISCIVSPLLPVVVTVGQVNAARRLETQGIFSLNVQRITLAGKVRVFCFDKTGTLTKQGLDFLGVQSVSGGAFASTISRDVATAPPSQEMLFALATCHSVGSLEDRLVGNEVEVRMFTATGWDLVEREGEQPCVRSRADPAEELEFIKRYDFDHHRMSMSVVVKSKHSGKYFVFCKGSYERMEQLCAPSGSVPADYQRVADRQAKDGCYVLGLGVRELPSEWTEEQVLEFANNRDAVDEGLSLLGLILFRNELKGDTADAIAKLKTGDVRVVMITGDNAMCGCYIARQSGMIAEGSRVLLGEMVATTEIKALVWRDVDSDETFDLFAVKHMVEAGENVELAVTGAAFDQLCAIGEMANLLLHVRIFSRMTPDGKVACVKMHMETGAVTGMCGDGGNDCGALRFAHCGVALSDAEASVVSPFTSKAKTIESVVDLCREGRCSVATSFASVKFLIMYGLVASTLRMFQYYHAVIMSEWCWVMADGVTLVGLSYVITLSRPLPELKSQRPTSSLIGPTTLASILGQEAINVAFLASSIYMLMHEVWFCPFSPDSVDVAKWWLLSDNHMATSLFFSVIFQQQVAAWVFSFGSDYRLPIWRNYLLVVVVIVLMAFDLYLLLGEPSVVTDLFRISSSPNVVGLPDIPMPKSFRLKYFGMILGNMATTIVYEYFVVLGPVRTFFRNKYHKDHLPMKK